MCLLPFSTPFIGARGIWTAMLPPLLPPLTPAPPRRTIAINYTMLMTYAHLAADDLKRAHATRSPLDNL